MLIVVCVMAFGPTTLAADGSGQPAGADDAKVPAVKVSDDSDFQKLPKPGAKVPLDGDHYFIYGFDKRPKLGAAIMKVEVFTQAGRPDTSFVVKGDLDMPSMKGAHSTGEKEFTLSKKGAYLLPSEIVMPGDWEFKFTFEKGGKTVFRGAYQFDI